MLEVSKEGLLSGVSRLPGCGFLKCELQAFVSPACKGKSNGPQQMVYCKFFSSTIAMEHLCLSSHSSGAAVLSPLSSIYASVQDGIPRCPVTRRSIWKLLLSISITKFSILNKELFSTALSYLISYLLVLPPEDKKGGKAVTLHKLLSHHTVQPPSFSLVHFFLLVELLF